MFGSSLRTRLLILFAALFLIVGTGTLVTIERTLSGDLTSTLDARLTAQGKAVTQQICFRPCSSCSDA